MNYFVYYFISFLLPSIVFATTVYLFGNHIKIGSLKQIFIIIVFIAISAFIALLFLYNLDVGFPLKPYPLSLAIFIAAASVTIFMLRAWGLFYTISVILQELCLLSNAMLVFRFSNIFMAIIMIVPVYIVSHLQTMDHAKLKIIITGVWGISAIILFWLLSDFYLISGLHLIAGAILINKNILLTRTKIPNR